MSEDKWVVDYETPDGTRQAMAWETERMADGWISCHRGQHRFFNMSKRRVTNGRATLSQAERALHGQLGTSGPATLSQNSTTATAQNNSCPHCGLIHATTCWRIKSLEYYPDGTLKRVELHEQRSGLGDVAIRPASSPAGVAPGTGTGSVSGGSGLHFDYRYRS